MKSETFRSSILSLSWIVLATEQAALGQPAIGFPTQSAALSIAPRILAQPLDQRGDFGGVATFSVTAESLAPLSYQWARGGTNVRDATNATLTLTNLQLGQAGRYAVLITTSGGWIASSNALLRVVSSECLPNPPGLVGRWPGDGNTYDLVQGGQATLVGGTDFKMALVRQGFSFDGVDDRVLVPNAPALNFGTNQDFSIECWIRAEPDTKPPSVRSIVEKRNADENYRGYALFLWDGRLACQLSEINGGANFLSGGGDLRDNTFHHVAVTVDRDAHTGGKLFVDGRVVGTFDPTPFQGDLRNADLLRIGSHPTPGDTSSFFQGIIDDVSIYNRALDLEEIKAIFEAGSAGKCLPFLRAF